MSDERMKNLLRAVKSILLAAGWFGVASVLSPSPAWALPAQTAGAIPLSWWLSPLSAVAALLVAYGFYRWMMKQPAGNETMVRIAGYVREGAHAYLRRQYSVVGKIFIGLAILLGVLAVLGIQNPFVPISFLTGGFFSGLCGYLGM